MIRVYNEIDIDELYKIYFCFIKGEHYLINALKEFSNGGGYGYEEVCCTFPVDYNYWEEGYFGESGVKINI